MGRQHRYSIFGEDVTDDPELWEDTDIVVEGERLTPEERYEKIQARRTLANGYPLDTKMPAPRTMQRRFLRERRERRQRRVAGQRPGAARR